MNEVTKIKIHTIANGAYAKAAEMSIKSAAHATYSVDAMLCKDYKTAAASAATAMVMAPISAATGVLLAGASVIVGATILTAATTGMAVDAVKSLKKDNTSKAAPAQN